MNLPAAGADSADADGVQPVRVREVQLRRQGEPADGHQGLPQAAAAAERLLLHVPPRRAPHRRQHRRRVGTAPYTAPLICCLCEM